MRSVLPLFLILFSSLGSAAPGQTETPLDLPPVEVGPREALVYKAHAEAVAFVNAANLAQLRGLRTCICQTTRCEASGTLRMQGFEKTFIDFLGTKRAEQVSCEEIVPKFFEKVRVANAEARMGLALGYGADGQYVRSIQSPLSPGLDLARLSASEEAAAALKIRELALDKFDRGTASKREMQFRRFYVEQYFHAVKQANIILYLDTDTVTEGNVVRALERMIGNAEARLDFEVSKPRDLEKSTWALPYTEALLRKKFPNDDFATDIAAILSRASSMQLVATAVEIASIVGSVLMCRFVPVGKPLILLARISARRGCQVFAAGAASLYFLVESRHQQKALLKFYMSSLESSKTRVTRGQLMSAQAQVYLAILTLPFAAL